MSQALFGRPDMEADIARITGNNPDWDADPAEVTFDGNTVKARASRQEKDESVMEAGEQDEYKFSVAMPVAAWGTNTIPVDGKVIAVKLSNATTSENFRVIRRIPDSLNLMLRFDLAAEFQDSA